MDDVTLRQPLILFSHPVEMAPCVEGIHASTIAPVRVERVGIGRDAGHRAAHLLTEGERPSAVFVLGSAGWLHLKDPPPVPIWATEVKSEGGQVLRPSVAVPGAIIDRAGFHRARLVTVRRPVMDYQRALQLAADLNVDIVDMESFHVCQAALARGVPCAVVRGVTDLARRRAREQYRANVETMMRQVGKSVAPIIEWLDRREQQRVERAKSGTA